MFFEPVWMEKPGGESRSCAICHGFLKILRGLKMKEILLEEAEIQVWRENIYQRLHCFCSVNNGDSLYPDSELYPTKKQQKEIL